MGKKIITFNNIEVEKKFINTRTPISIHDVNIDRIVVSNKLLFGKKSFKHFIGYKDGKKVRLLSVMPPKMMAYRKDFDEAKYVFFDTK